MTRWFDPALQNLVIGSANTTFDGSETTLISQGGSVREVSTSDFVASKAGTSNPLMDGVAAPGASSLYSRQDHVHPTDTTRMPLTPSFESTEQGIVASTLVTVAHGLSRVPKLFRVVIRNKTAEFGFNPGDEVDVTGGAIDAANNPASGNAADSTNIYIGTSSSQPVVLNRTTLARVAITTANWKYVAYAW